LDPGHFPVPYGEILQLDKLLDCARSPTPIEQDEMLFIHRAPVAELWMAAVPARAGPCVRVRAARQSGSVVQDAARISRLQEELLGA